MPTVVLVRHGQASFGERNYDALSPLGREQARVVGEALRPRLPSLSRAAAGSLVRQQETARGCLSAMGLPPEFETHPGLDELDHVAVLARYDRRYADPDALGADLLASGDPHRTFQRLFTEAMGRWLSGRRDGDYDEPFPAFRARCLTALRDLAATPSGEPVLAFTSAGPIAVVVQHLLGLPHERFLETLFTLANASLSTVRSGPAGLELVSWNEHSHLGGDGRRLLTYR